MHIKGICINADVDRLGGSLVRLEEDLDYFQECGFDGVELAADGLDVVLGGRLNRSQVDRVRAITGRYPFAYTVHPPGRLNLAFPQRGAGGVSDLVLEKDVFAACLEFCAAVGAGVMVYHSGLIGLYEYAFGLGALPGPEELEAARSQEVAALRELMPLAVELGVVVGMENRDPHPWELAVLRRAGQPDDALVTYHAGLTVPALLRQVTEVGHPQLGLTLDLGHLYLAAGQCGFDYLDGVRQAAPYVRHLHAHDNFGRLGWVHTGLHSRLPYGDGDTHLPPGWGRIPHLESLAALDGYEGLYVLEILPRFRAHLAQALESTRQLIEQAQSPQGA
ncbi:MAG: sugar phosphate isomerase/epimerase [Anaerolineae bacterium]|nr:sugar phosphate isomerase/epimerase [Anaerolineae bacterium]